MIFPRRAPKLLQQQRLAFVLLAAIATLVVPGVWRLQTAIPGENTKAIKHAVPARQRPVAVERRLPKECKKDDLFLAFLDPQYQSVASSYCSTLIRQTVGADAAASIYHTSSVTDTFTATATATVTVTDVVGSVETDISTSTLPSTVVVVLTNTAVNTDNEPTTVATDVVRVTDATKTVTLTVATSGVTDTIATKTVTVNARGKGNDQLPGWVYNLNPSQLSSACSCILTTALPPATTIYTRTTTYTGVNTIDVSVTDTATVTNTVTTTQISVSTFEIDVIVTQTTSQTSFVTVTVTTTDFIPETFTTTLDVTKTTTDDVTATSTLDVTATATATNCCSCVAPFRIQVTGTTSGNPANGQYLQLQDSSALNDYVLGFVGYSAASIFTLNSQCQLITGGRYSAVGPGDFYDIVREDLSGNFPLTCAVNPVTKAVTCAANAGGGLNTEFSYNALGFLAFETPSAGGSDVLTLKAV